MATNVGNKVKYSVICASYKERIIEAQIDGCTVRIASVQFGGGRGMKTMYGFTVEDADGITLKSVPPMQGYQRQRDAKNIAERFVRDR